MADELSGKVIMVTGAAGSVGQGVVRACAAAGAKVALVDLDAGQISSVIDEIGGSHLKGFDVDLSDPEAVDKALADIEAQMGAVQALVHTVGGYAAGQPVHAGRMDVFDRMMNLNTRILYLVCGKVAAHMLERGIAGSISVILARGARQGTKHHAAYAASKAAGARIMESMSAELRDNNIRVNGISPSIIDTPPNREAMPNADFDAWVKPAQIGDLAVFLASDASAAITGAEIVIAARS